MTVDSRSNELMAHRFGKEVNITPEVFRRWRAECLSVGVRRKTSELVVPLNRGGRVKGAYRGS